MPDLTVYDRIKTKQDYDRMNEEFMLKKQLAQAELKKANYLDVDKLGEQAFMKAAMGQQLTPRERAAALVVDAKSGGVGFDPATQQMYQKPRISEKIGLDGFSNNVQGVQGMDIALPQNTDMSQGNLGFNLPVNGEMVNADMGSIPMPDKPPLENQPTSYWDQQYQAELNAAAGNPKLIQDIKSKYSTARMQPTEGQSNAALYATRMAESDPIIEKYAAAGKDAQQAVMGSIPLVGNFITSKDYQSFDQARRNFINATLRRESGAVISPAEFESANRQYFPQPGDSEQVLAQKAKNRKTATDFIARAAGPSYEPPVIQDPYPDAPPAKSTAKVSNIPMGAIKDLKANPETAAQFDEIFGEGAAKKVLGK